jgi:hypothetical protein
MRVTMQLRQAAFRVYTGEAAPATPGSLTKAAAVIRPVNGVS